LRKVNGLAAFVTLVRLIEFIGKDFLGRTAFRAFALEGFEVFERLKAGAVLRGRHHDLLSHAGGAWQLGVYLIRGSLPAPSQSGV
jgi:hypothetical protein